MKTPLLEIEDLYARVGDKEIIKGFNLTINEGEVHAIMGPNGAGKSTLSYVLSGKPGYRRQRPFQRQKPAGNAGGRARPRRCFSDYAVSG